MTAMGEVLRVLEWSSGSWHVALHHVPSMGDGVAFGDANLGLCFAL